MISPQIAPKLKKLLLMLSSNQGGEVVAAANAIERTLRDAGCGWHDLVGGLLTTPESKPRQHRNTDGPRDIDWHAMLRFCTARTQLLREREQDFICKTGEASQLTNSWHGCPRSTHD